MSCEVKPDNLCFQIVAKLETDKKNKGIRLKKIIVSEEENFVMATLMANNSAEYLKVREEFEKYDEKICLKGAGKGLRLIVKGDEAGPLIIEAFSKIKNFEVETEKFVKFLYALLQRIDKGEINQNLGREDIQMKINSLNFLENLASIEIEVKSEKALDKDEFCDKFLNLNFDYEFGIIK